jgi:two-component system, OmpR family, copper resistance phosphate regulon response regulator CusR
LNILLVEDDPRIASVVCEALSEEGHHVDALSDGREVEEHLLAMPYNLAVLDLMMPGRDGFDILKGVRNARSSVPILVLSARDSMADVVRALDLGADDYVTKPFHLDMLLARVRSVSRRGPVAEPAVLSVSGLVLDPSCREVEKEGTAISLTRHEFALLELLMRRANKVVSRGQLKEAGWGLAAEPTQNTLEFHIHSLRSKIDRVGEPSLIRTVRAMGYRFGV